MKCIICSGTAIANQVVEEEIRRGDDIILASVEALVCMACGERYYERSTMRRLEDMARDIQANRSPLQEVGRVLRGV